MRRIFLEIFAGSFLCFFLGLVAMSYYFQEIRPDYDTQLSVTHVSSFARVVDDVTVIGNEKASSAIDKFVRDSFFDVKVISWEEVNGLSSQKKAELQENHAISIDDNEYLLYIGEKLYYLFPDDQYSIWDELDYEDSFLFYWFGGVFFVYSLVVVFLLHRRLKPLENATFEFANGVFSARAPERAGIRLGTLNEQFNGMAQRVSQLITSQKQLSNAVAHELRTPLFRMECQLALLEELEVSEDVQRHLDGLADDIEELEELVEELLYYARLEGLDMTPCRTLEAPSSWLSILVKKHQVVSPVPIFLECTDEEVNVDHVQFQRAMSNLIGNAIRYANSEVTIRAQVNNGQFEIQIEDDGPGIPESERESVFKPFYRIGAARDRKSGGHGLGLAIVAQVIRGHSGTIVIESNKHGGATFIVTVPVH